MCLEIHELATACFLTTPGLAQQVALKNTKVKLDLLTGIDILLIEEKYTRIGIRCSSLLIYKS